MATESVNRKRMDASTGAGTEDESAIRAEFGERLVEMREARGWSRAELASRLGISRQRLANWERGSHSPTLETLVALKRVLDIPLDELVTGEKAKAPGLSRDQRYQAMKHTTELMKLLR